MKLSSVYLCLYIYIFNWELYIYINVTDHCVYIRMSWKSSFFLVTYFKKWNFHIF